MLSAVLLGIERFEILDQRIGRLLDTIDQVPKAYARALGPLIATEARRMLGTYQERIGEYPGWQDLTQATLDRRAARGINPNDEPLLETGAMRDSIATERIAQTPTTVVFVVGYTITPGTMENDDGEGDYPMWHEVGTGGMPPRPVFGPAVLKIEERAKGVLADITRSHFNEIAGVNFGTRFWGEGED